MIYAPLPSYPYAARSRNKTGFGIAVVEIDPTSGRVIRAEMAESTSHPELDDAALSAFRDWRFKPGTEGWIKIPVRFLTHGRVISGIEEKSKPMEEILAPFLGKGTFLKGQMPSHPPRPWTDKQGKGVYELHVAKDGNVADVKILKSSGDAAFDRSALNALRKWKLRKGPLIIELPLAFKMTSARYDVGIP